MLEVLIPQEIISFEAVDTARWVMMKGAVKKLISSSCRFTFTSGMS